VLLLERFNILEKNIGLVVEVIALGLEIKDVLVGFVPEILVFLRLFHKLPGLIVERIAFAGELACSSIEFVAFVFVLFRLYEVFFLFSIRSFNMRYNSSSQFTFAESADFLSLWQQWSKMGLLLHDP